MKRLFDIVCSAIGLIILSPFLILIALLVKVTSNGPIFYLQNRVGHHGAEFKLFKFRTMYTDADKKGLLTVGGRDPRITGIGYVLRKYKLDELPQLLNVLIGEMSLVGPRPEVKKYVDLYNEDQRKVLSVKPGITDYASLEYFQENELLGKSSDPEKTYIEEVMPAKLKLNLKYIHEAGLITDLRLIFKTLLRIVS
jgi:lipopolysaccharide/colanic/teichoic acid biosynthesis glycosyltransferase